MCERRSIDAARPWTERAVRLYRVDEGRWPSERRVDTDNVDCANDINKRIVIKTARHFARAPSTRAASDRHRTSGFRFSSQVDAENLHIVRMPFVR
jgi:hypothetical protein